jgi:hypothetical protein
MDRRDAGPRIKDRPVEWSPTLSKLSDELLRRADAIGPNGVRPLSITAVILRLIERD